MFTFSAFFVVVGWAVRTSGDRSSSMRGLAFQGFGLISIMAAAVFFFSMYSQYHSAKKALLARDYSVTEGIVTDFIPMPPGGHATESFRINGVRFEYGGGWGSTVFNSDWNKNFIHNGVQARITHRGSDMLRVELR